MKPIQKAPASHNVIEGTIIDSTTSVVEPVVLVHVVVVMVVDMVDVMILEVMEVMVEEVPTTRSPMN